MYLIKITIIVNAFACSLSAIVSSDRNSFKFQQNCLKTIQQSYFKSNFFIIFFNVDEDLIDLIQHDVLTVIQNNFTQLHQFSLAKADAYILTLNINNFRSTFEFLRFTSEWNPRAKFVIYIDGNVDDKFLLLLKKYYVFNVIFLVARIDHQIDIYTSFPYTPDTNGLFEIKTVLLDTCFDGKLKKSINLFPNKLPNTWNDFEVKLVLMEYPPYIICYNCSDNQKDGMELTLFKMVSQQIGFKITYLNKQFSYWGAYIKENNNFSEVYGALQNYEADAALGLFYANFTETWYFDCSFTYMEDASKWIVPSAKLNDKWNSIVKAFPLNLWILFLFSLILVSLVLWVISNVLAEKKFNQLSVCVSILFQCSISHSIGIHPESFSARMILSIWLLFNLCMYGAYQSKLIDILNFDSYGKQISNSQELIESDLEFGFSPFAATLFSKEEGAITRHIIKNHQICELGKVCVDRVGIDGNFATIKVSRNALFMIGNYYLDENGISSVYVFKDDVLFTLIRSPFSKGFPLFEKINKVLVQLKAHGFVEYLYRKEKSIFLKTIKRAHKLASIDDDLTFNELKGAFMVLALGWSLSTVIFVIEILTYTYSFVYFNYLSLIFKGRIM